MWKLAILDSAFVFAISYYVFFPPEYLLNILCFGSSLFFVLCSFSMLFWSVSKGLTVCFWSMFALYSFSLSWVFVDSGLFLYIGLDVLWFALLSFFLCTEPPTLSPFFSLFIFFYPRFLYFIWRILFILGWCAVRFIYIIYL